MAHPNSKNPHEIRQVLHEGYDLELFEGKLDSVIARLQGIREAAKETQCADIVVDISVLALRDYGDEYVESQVTISGTRPETQKEIDKRRAAYSKRQARNKRKKLAQEEAAAAEERELYLQLKQKYETED